MVYDNLRTAIRRFVGRQEKQATESFLKLSTYYQFRRRFCNVRQPREKGHSLSRIHFGMERRVEYVRRKAFASRDCFESLEQANTYLHSVCQGLNGRLQGKEQNAAELFKKESAQLYGCPARFDCGELGECRVDKYSTICQGTNHYSVPDHLVGKRVDVRLYHCCITGAKRTCQWPVLWRRSQLALSPAPIGSRTDPIEEPPSA